jgi:hypothetical protein
VCCVEEGGGEVAQVCCVYTMYCVFFCVRFIQKPSLIVFYLDSSNLILPYVYSVFQQLRALLEIVKAAAHEELGSLTPFFEPLLPQSVMIHTIADSCVRCWHF